jgi:curved DNA-binding protein CbpA
MENNGRPHKGRSVNEGRDQGQEGILSLEQISGMTNEKFIREFLGISTNIDEAALGKAKRRIALKYHPDRGGNGGTMAYINNKIDELINVVKNGGDPLQNARSWRDDYQDYRDWSYGQYKNGGQGRNEEEARRRAEEEARRRAEEEARRRREEQERKWKDQLAQIALYKIGQTVSYRGKMYVVGNILPTKYVLFGEEQVEISRGDLEKEYKNDSEYLNRRKYEIGDYVSVPRSDGSIDRAGWRVSNTRMIRLIDGTFLPFYDLVSHNKDSFLARKSVEAIELEKVNEKFPSEMSGGGRKTQTELDEILFTHFDRLITIIPRIVVKINNNILRCEVSHLNTGEEVVLRAHNGDIVVLSKNEFIQNLYLTENIERYRQIVEPRLRVGQQVRCCIESLTKGEYYFKDSNGGFTIKDYKKGRPGVYVISNGILEVEINKFDLEALNCWI